jgi:hypothetical protein
MSDPFEQALRRALRSQSPGDAFPERVIAQLDADARSAARVARLGARAHRAWRSRWMPAALAACLIAGIGLLQMRQHAIEAARAERARAQLLQALSIASDDINVVRAAVAHEENPDS